ncbi:hypothetical protein AA0X95_20255 [Bacillus sp. 1P10SD]|uniref:hypothetical protein n=1 Tax=Bacillus sp. 1P10SD TaxID=3132265 RepID=UPI0039A6F6EF
MHNKQNKNVESFLGICNKSDGYVLVDNAGSYQVKIEDLLSYYREFDVSYGQIEWPINKAITDNYEKFKRIRDKYKIYRIDKAALNNSQLYNELRTMFLDEYPSVPFPAFENRHNTFISFDT